MLSWPALHPTGAALGDCRQHRQKCRCAHNSNAAVPSPPLGTQPCAWLVAAQNPCKVLTLLGNSPNSSMTQYQPPLCRGLLQLHRWANSCRAGAVASRSSVSRRQLSRVRLSVNSLRPSSCTLRNTLAGSQGGCCSTHLHAQAKQHRHCQADASTTAQLSSNDRESLLVFGQQTRGRSTHPLLSDVYPAAAFVPTALQGSELQRVCQPALATLRLHHHAAHAMR